MPKRAKELSALEVKRLAKTERSDVEKHAVGGVSGLYIQCGPSGAASWLLRVNRNGRRPEYGLGPYPEVPLASARDAAREAKAAFREGRDLFAERAAANRPVLTFRETAEEYFTVKFPELKSDKDRKQWRASFENHVFAKIGARSIADVDRNAVLEVLKPIWIEKNDTASKLRGRIEGVLNFAKVKGYREGENPAQWKGNLDALLSKPSKVRKTENYPAIPVDIAPVWFSELQKREGMGALALQFCALTAARSGEIRNAKWGEIDLDKALWIVPAERMKASREHRVPLSKYVIGLLNSLPRHAGCDLVFPSPRSKPLSDMTLSKCMKGLCVGDARFHDRTSGKPAVPHGLRSTFRDWTIDHTSYGRELAELALAHTISSKTEQAYRRSDSVAKRRPMMEDWSAYLRSK